MENMGIRKLVDELRKLNPNVDIEFKADTFPAIIIASCSNCAELELPNGYYISCKNSLTNKHNTTSGQYELFDLVTKYEYLTMLA